MSCSVTSSNILLCVHEEFIMIKLFILSYILYIGEPLWRTIRTFSEWNSSHIIVDVLCTAQVTPENFVKRCQGESCRIHAITAGAAPVTLGRSCSSTLTSYTCVTPDEIMQLLRHRPNKWCALDLLPTWVVKGCSAGMSTIIAKLVNASLNCTTFAFPSSMKHAMVRPIVKKASLDPSLLTSYRLISHLHLLH